MQENIINVCPHSMNFCTFLSMIFKCLFEMPCHNGFYNALLNFGQTHISFTVERTVMKSHKVPKMIMPAENKVNKNIFLSEAETFKCKNKSGVCNRCICERGSNLSRNTLS